MHPSEDPWEECRQRLGQWAQGPPETQANYARCREGAGTQPADSPGPAPARADSAAGNPQLGRSRFLWGHREEEGLLGPEGYRAEGQASETLEVGPCLGGASEWPLKALELSPLGLDRTETPLVLP